MLQFGAAYVMIAPEVITMIFFLIRHGDPIYRPDSLTELGHKQAAALVDRFVKFGLDEIYCSTSIRAQMTAQPTAEALGMEIKLCPWAHENLVLDDMCVYNDEGKLEVRPFHC